MGRTVPSYRSVLDDYVEGLRRAARRVGDPDVRRDLEELLNHAHDLENAFVEELGSPEEEVLLSLTLHLLREVKRMCSNEFSGEPTTTK